MADIDLYVDPVCPFAWVAAQWLLDTAADKHAVTLRPMSLAVLNGDHDVDADHAPMIIRSRRIGRVFAAAVQQYGQSAFSPLYTEFGLRSHAHARQADDAVAAALAATGFDQQLIEALDDTRYDAAVAHAHRASQTALGGRGGSPIISVDGHVFSGPVLTEPPAPGRATELLAAIVTAATTPGFAALQRPYQGPPAVADVEEEQR
ncbi:mycothiol-dependent nitroreductase Rv2466c family protein [Nocardia beijingensis]|uniref:mycothiol-dependent nitroreductase Rv2466c family protein n=1 Tax=Nocardia beijingensis TaxID=95162 RepID=UPI0018957EC1|nr:disulfide bond formation protein DsbA [Nocardia beijingensis]MBF6076703.1 disulfide bond formation protein DsbA [Nocardia beijingensis]